MEVLNSTLCAGTMFAQSSTRKELRRASPPPHLYVYRTWNVGGVMCSVTTAVKKIFCYKVLIPLKIIMLIIFFPIGLYYLLRFCVGCCVHPATISWFRKYVFRDVVGLGIDQCRENILDRDFEYETIVKRFSILVDGYVIDAIAVCRKEDLQYDRWMLCSLGNGEFYEKKVLSPSLEEQMANQINSGCIFYNYPNVGRSSGGTFSSKNVTAVHIAFCQFILTQLNPKVMIEVGYSIGGGVQGESLRSRALNNQNVQHIFVKCMSFSSLAALLPWQCGNLAAFVGWHYDSANSSTGLSHHEFILQQGNPRAMVDDEGNSLPIKEMHSVEELAATDGIIPKTSTLAYAVHNRDRQNKTFFLVPEDHFNQLSDLACKTLAQAIIAKIRSN